MNLCGVVCSREMIQSDLKMRFNVKTKRNEKSKESTLLGHSVAVRVKRNQTDQKMNKTNLLRKPYDHQVNLFCKRMKNGKRVRDREREKRNTTKNIV